MKTFAGKTGVMLGLLALFAGQGTWAGEPPPEPVLDPATGFWSTTIDSEFLAGPVKVELLLPDHLDPAKTYPVLYIIPPVATGTAFGYGLTEAKKADIANKYGIICVYPSFTGHPWMANSATNPRDQKDDYMVKTLAPYIDSKFPTQKDKEGRWLLGFSKSGWGAYTLFFRHPDVFGYAAAWDVPFMIDGNAKDWGPMGLGENVGTKEALQAGFLPTKLAADNASWLKSRNRLVLGNGQFWKAQNEQMHALLVKLGIPHTWLPDLQFPHRWDTGWFPTVVDELVKIARAPQN